MKASQLDKLLDCDCEVCYYRHYISTDDCDIRRKKAIKSALYSAIEERMKEKIRKEGFDIEDESVLCVLSAIKEIFE